MAYIKCPACMLNYIPDTEDLCPVCKKERSGGALNEDGELCLDCGVEPAEPGEDYCAGCLELRGSTGNSEKSLVDDDDDDWSEDSPKEDEERTEVPLDEAEKDDDDDEEQSY